MSYHVGQATAAGKDKGKKPEDPMTKAGEGGSDPEQ